MEHTADLRSFGRYASLNVLGMLGLSCYILVDTFFVSCGMGANGLAALNIAIPAYNLLNGLGLMIGVGGATRYTVSCAQCDNISADRAFTHAVGLGLAVGLLFMLIGLAGAAPVSRLLGADADTFPLTSVYLRTLLSFAPFFVMNNVLLAFVRNDGAPGRAMCGMIVGSLSNVVLDYVFIFPCDWGMFGAAFATGLSPIISLLILSGHLRSPVRGFHLCRVRPQGRLLASICASGISSFVGELSSAVVLFLFNFVLLRISGNTGVAAYGIVANLALVAIAIFQGLSTGMQPLVSHSSGLNDHGALRRFYRYGITSSLAIATLLYVLVFVFAAPITAVFNSENNAVLAGYAVTGLRIYFCGFWFAGCNIVSSIFFRASGRSAQGFLLSMLRGVIAIVPFLFLMTAWFGITGVWVAFPATELFTFLFTAVCAAKAFRRTA